MPTGDGALGDGDEQRRCGCVVLDDEPDGHAGNDAFSAVGEGPRNEVSRVTRNIGSDVLSVSSPAIELKSLVVDGHRQELALIVEATENVVSVAPSLVTLVVELGSQQPNHALRRVILVEPRRAAHAARREFESRLASNLTDALAALSPALVILPLLEEDVDECALSAQ